MRSIRILACALLAAATLGLSACAAGIYYLWMRGDVAQARRLDHELARSRAEAAPDT